MERIVYRKTLDVHKNGVQFTLQGFETADKLSRVIEINLMASGDTIDLPIERLEALMYVTTPNATEPSINKCTIKNNTIVYEVLPIAEEGITTMQLKLIESRKEGASGVLASPKFAVEVTKSDADDSEAEKGATFTALEEAIAMAREIYDKACIGIELTSDCIFRAKYNDGTYYETDLLKELFVDGTVKLSESYAHGGTGIRTGEDTDNSMYYCNEAKSAALNAENTINESKEILGEVKKHGVYTTFSVDFETGEVEYVSPSAKFNINNDTGVLDATGYTYTFEDEIDRIVEEFFNEQGIDAGSITTNTALIYSLQDTAGELHNRITELEEKTRPIEKGGTGGSTKEEALGNLGAVGAFTINHTFNVDNNDAVNEDMIEFEQKPLFVIFPRAMMWDKMVYYGQPSAYFNSGTSSNHVSELTWGQNENGKYYLKINHSKYSNLRSMKNEPIIVIVDTSIYKP